MPHRFGVVEMAALARLPDANLLWIGRNNPARLQGNVIWQQLPFSQPARSAMLPVISPTGALISTQRFDRALARAVPALASRHVV